MSDIDNETARGLTFEYLSDHNLSINLFSEIFEKILAWLLKIKKEDE